MSNTRIAQGHKVMFASGGQSPLRNTQSHKVVLITTGAVPSQITQSHTVFLFQPSAAPPAGAIYKGSDLIINIFKGETPIQRVYAGDALTHQST